ncbi:MAG TPA: thermonuclease family protein [Pseudomonadales bacterium]|nr:thermonuclease family protein [Pseudomonadales bacterium]HMW14734.1 thermonuclease family protein [Pseudomonadales bacterium]HMW82885.1 thermonuclease family protein [Pseudomonadales bacterium]HMY95743.1 thermonuclease family protein [Pseudomonadales bacterium]HMZ70682.1 thermonuclease family protein [Pseudomonadales bacterium]
MGRVIRMLPLLGVLALALACARSAPAAGNEGQPIAGGAFVIDGDTLTVAGQRIRLYGIDAPEFHQLCQRDGEPWRCGQAATVALTEFIGRRPVRCEPRDREPDSFEQGRHRYGRVIAVCSVGGAELNRWLVAEGHALAYRHYSSDYVADETQAQRARKGVWGSEFEPPWVWRHQSNGVSRRSTLAPSTTPPARTAAEAECGTKKRCAQMSSCAEARDHLTRCDIKSLDGDGDGVPCESLCR